MVTGLEQFDVVSHLQVDHQDPRGQDVNFDVDNGFLQVSVPTKIRENRYVYWISGEGCDQQECALPFRAKIDLTVEAPSQLDALSKVNRFAYPSLDRLSARDQLGGGRFALADELILTLGTPEMPGAPERAKELAQSVDALFTGGIAEIGVYQFRFLQPPHDLESVVGELMAQDDVTSVARSTFGEAEQLVMAEPPGDWDDDRDDDVATWHLSAIRAQKAWDLTTGSGVRVGILDDGRALGGHEDLNVVQSVDSAPVSGHATHVAGLACAEANGLGLVGASWGCPVVSGSARTVDGYFFDHGVLESAYKMVDADVQVLNMSIGWYQAKSRTERCVADMSAAQTFENLHKPWAPAWRNLQNGERGRHVVWTMSAGNDCSPYAVSPWQMNYGLPNVLVVGATNYDGRLASFSNWGPAVEVAAPGGVGEGLRAGGVWSTSARTCGLFNTGTCSHYEPLSGTSMAAPLVAGVAALVLSADSSLTAAEVASCISTTAGRGTGYADAISVEPRRLGEGENVVTFQRPFFLIPFREIPRVNAEAAVLCGQGRSFGGDVLVVGEGDRTGSGDGTDLGDLVSVLTEGGYVVAASSTLPEDVSDYGSIWHIDTDMLAQAEQNSLVSYVESGGGLFLTGEWGCCSVDQSTIAILNRIVEKGGITHGGATSSDVVELRQDAPGGITSSPSILSSLIVSYAGTLQGVDERNLVGRAGAGDDRAVVAAWTPDETVGSGRAVAVMDINWFARQYRGTGWENFVKNVSQFLMGQ